MILPPDFEARTVEQAREVLLDIVELSDVQITCDVQGHAPVLRFAFGDTSKAHPILRVNLVAESKKNPLAPGRLITGDLFRRVVREWVETYMKMQGIPVTKKAEANARL